MYVSLLIALALGLAYVQLATYAAVWVPVPFAGWAIGFEDGIYWTQAAWQIMLVAILAVCAAYPLSLLRPRRLLAYLPAFLLPSLASAAWAVGTRGNYTGAAFWANLSTYLAQLVLPLLTVAVWVRLSRQQSSQDEM